MKKVDPMIASATRLSMNSLWRKWKLWALVSHHDRGAKIYVWCRTWFNARSILETVLGEDRGLLLEAAVMAVWGNHEGEIAFKVGEVIIAEEEQGKVVLFEAAREATLGPDDDLGEVIRFPAGTRVWKPVALQRGREVLRVALGVQEDRQGVDPAPPGGPPQDRGGGDPGGSKSRSRTRAGKKGVRRAPKRGVR